MMLGGAFVDKVNILGVKVSKHTIDSASDAVVEYVHRGEKRKCVYTPNSEIIMVAYRDPDFAEVLNKADLLLADGIGVVYASKILGNPIPSRAAGFDTARAGLSKLSDKGGATLYLFGSAPGVADMAKDKICELYPGINVVGTANGYFDAEREKEIIEEINSLKPDLLFVCLGAPKQEKWLHAHIDELDVGVAFGLGGSLDVFAGTVKRAPEFFQKHGIEWLYRLMKQPKRAIRMLDLPRFAIKVILKGRKFPQE